MTKLNQSLIIIIIIIIIVHFKEHDPEFAERVKLVKFQFYNAQWLEMVTGKSMFAGGHGIAGSVELSIRDEDEDYNPFMDPYYLQIAAELYSPELLYDEPLSHPLFTSPVAAVMDDPLAEYEQNFAFHSPVGAGLGAPGTNRPPSRLNF